MMEVELSPGNMPPRFIQVKSLVVRFRLYQHGCINRLVLIYLIRIGAGVTDIDLAKKHAAGALLEHAKGAAGDTELCRIATMLETLRHIPTVVHLAALILPIKQCETAIAKRLYQRTYHTLE